MAKGAGVLTCGGAFDGIGLLAYGLHLAGWEHRWLCERDPWRRTILEQRWPGVPVYPDVRELGAGAEPVVLLAGGFPCKGASTAGLRNGFDHAETVLWREMARAIGELRPRYVLVENVANILALHDGAVWGEVLGDLAALGYDTVWDCLPAAAVGAPHLRDRVFAVATHTASVDQRTEADEAHSQPRGGHAQLAGFADDAAAAQDTNSGPAQPAGGERRGEPQGAGEPLGVEWAEYAPAIERWERALGRRAGEPLLSGVVARGARRVVRSRLSALGDGVQVQVGQIVGAYIAELEREQMRAAA